MTTAACASSPAKRRVLGPLDANAPSPGSRQQQQQQHGKRVAGNSTPLREASLEPADLKKRLLAMAALIAAKRSSPAEGAEPSAKRARLAADSAAIGREDENSTSHRNSNPVAARRSVSPAPSSVFDSSVMDTSQATNITEPDADVAAVPAAAAAPAPVLAPPQPRVLTREESRQRAEILRLRLGLANYKLRTGQADVPLEQLRMLPLPGADPARNSTARLPSFAALVRNQPPQQQQQQPRQPSWPRRPLPQERPRKKPQQGEEAPLRPVRRPSPYVSSPRSGTPDSGRSTVEAEEDASQRSQRGSAEGDRGTDDGGEESREKRSPSASSRASASASDAERSLPSPEREASLPRLALASLLYSPSGSKRRANAEADTKMEAHAEKSPGSGCSSRSASPALGSAAKGLLSPV